MASCNEQNIPSATGLDNSMNWISPITCCHFFVDVRRWVGGILTRIVCSLSTRWARNQVILVVVFSNHPRTTLRVAQVALHFISYLIVAGSWRYGPSALLIPQNTLPILCSNTRFARPRLAAPPCTIPIKLLTYMSHWTADRWTCTCCHSRGSVLGCTLFRRVVIMLAVSAATSRWCMPWTARSLMPPLARWAIVSVLDVTMGGDLFHPIH
jgi:hypothetical protein